ncbi:3-carboxy-cis,cis-muconate cycloisomerase [Bradyrhizobium sp. U87765 SZCCT0131]|uniref:3-carboxy-cis,cis-muconate cycloisomerase n=1 Tax=unclassified Bradyrhizobium TaxID=2631580 RepID=UPI001BA4D40E|nr:MULTISPECIES: 3-carboxy-cis,cis-muconate cycloisomerase [unclassified Bradyrhizobium]MBR1222865.1 3-carboxy-cis,cis-muconate cycloisomerase [Bradyrhizobium sp. U87765 SZCCT0131]MBR1262601.1 3-carboxy-cis,cis-muconate cycloisomerase [Bradyrhizobium sp. U87765 SZCCT0134]MBR1308927.1 3-carboxy-cis,cis-muconate cycloisomerase [Bradyrhizobium sp. U87765 SZCCT0110]MBR1318383.1 3-carboxy-cis,cis-muconate cycloisomerase [Bradyrhizobium sp. U87765 SZCCT0109]MBR1352087.1 3-carboxy-cis,cis-muconate cy
MSSSLSPLLAPMLSSAAMRVVCDDATYLQFMLDFESALARAQARTGVVPQAAVAPIGDACKADRFDFAGLANAASRAGNLAIPLVKALTAAVATTDAEASRYVHWGATSQDVIDTATMLQLRAAIDALLPDLDRAVTGFAALARRHRDTAMVARTWLQHALPMPFGLKLAEYAAALNRSRQRLRQLRANGLALQFGGAAGTLAALGDKGLAVSEQLAAELQLPLPDAPWHTHRDRIAEAASVFAILTGTCGKIARDVSLMMQTDVQEAYEPAGEGRGGSSTLPHKRNPVAAASALGAATMAPNLAATIFAAQVQDHERSAGPWHAEWPTLPTLMLVTSGALAAIVDIAEGLDVNVERMRANLDTTHGLIMAEAVSMALADAIGKSEAHHIIEAASRAAIAQKKHLRDVLAADSRVTAHLDAARLDRLFDPLAYQGGSQALIDRLLISLGA